MKDKHHLIKNPNQMKNFSTSADFKGLKKLGEIRTYLCYEIVSEGVFFHGPGQDIFENCCTSLI